MLKINITYTFILFIILTISYSCEHNDNKSNGDIVFWSDIDRFDCGITEVEISINDNYVGKIDKSFVPYDSIPVCGSDNTLSISHEAGEYKYRAECYCGLTSRSLYGFLEGTIIVKKDSCLKVFLDLSEFNH